MSRTATAQIERPGVPGYDALFQQPPLVEWFRRLYREVTVIKARLAEAPPLAGPGDVGTFGEGGGDGEAAAAPSGLTTAEVHGRLRSVLDERPPAGGGSHVEEVRYALAAMADEVFIHLPWSGSEAWRFNLLEAALFGTHRAGEEVFARIDHLLAHGDRSARHQEAALVYLLMLSLGFEGQYRGEPEARDTIERLRRELYRFLSGHGVQPEDALALSPEAYAFTLAPAGAVRRLPYLRRWLIALGVLLGGWLITAHFLWRHLVSDLEPLLARILG